MVRASKTEHWDRAAPRYDAATALLERRLMARGRRWACARARGRVLEIGIGTGANLPHYGADVQLVGVDPSAAMLAQTRTKLARDAAGRQEAGEQGADRPGATVAALLRADAGALPFPDATFDAVVSTYVMCCVPDLDRALREALRVLRPGGDLLLADHVASTAWPVRLGQRALESVTVRAAEEHFTRRPVDRLAHLGADRTAGVELVDSQRHTLGVMEAVHARRGPGPAG